MDIDFVITWVDSNDDGWRDKKNNALSKIGKPMEKAADDERYRDYGTLKYLLRSIDRYATWVHKIYLVTDNQRPTWLKENLKDTKLEIIDHQDIIPKESLPTFNSNAIEMCIDNIPGLSEHFVEFNDDFLINKSVNPSDFFDNGKPKDFRQYTSLFPTESYDRLRFNDAYAINKWLGRLQEKWPINGKGIISSKYSISSNVKNMFFLIDRHRHVSDYVLPHNAYPLKKSNLRKAKKIWSNEINNTIRQKFRSEHDVTIFLFRDYQLEIGDFSPRSPTFSHFYVLNDFEEICRDLRQEKSGLLCINDSDTNNFIESTKVIQKALESKFKKKSRFEI